MLFLSLAICLKLHNTRGEEIAPDSNGPESVYFFKTGMEPHIGEVSYFKVMSGYGEDRVMT